jgi:hypothetical protein
VCQVLAARQMAQARVAHLGAAQVEGREVLAVPEVSQARVVHLRAAQVEGREALTALEIGQARVLAVRSAPSFWGARTPRCWSGPWGGRAAPDRADEPGERATEDGMVPRRGLLKKGGCGGGVPRLLKPSF